MSKNPLKREIIVTNDGSQTLFIPELNEQYHSLNGAVQESEHVFIAAGFNQLKHLSAIKIFELGFGSGLNALLTFFCNAKQKITYHSIEKYPLNNKEYSILNFAEFIEPQTNLGEVFSLMHQCEWNKYVGINSQFKLKKEQRSFVDLVTDEKYNLIYFDAFAPEIQPDLWTVEVFEKMFKILEPNGILVTYCAKGQVRRNMMQVGFKVERIPGPPGKREMMRATKPLV